MATCRLWLCPHRSSPPSCTSFWSQLKCHYSNLIPLLPLSHSRLPINTTHISPKLLTIRDYVTLPLLAVSPVRQGSRLWELTVVVPDSAPSRCLRNSACCMISTVNKFSCVPGSVPHFLPICEEEDLSVLSKRYKHIRLGSCKLGYEFQSQVLKINLFFYCLVLLKSGCAQ